MTDGRGTSVWDTRTDGPEPPSMFTGRVNTYGPRGGRYHHYLLDGETVEGVTTIISKGVSKGDVLSRWAANKVAAAAVDSQGYWRKLDRDEAVQFLKNSPYRDKTEAGARGTEVHGWAEHFASTGQLPDPGDVDEVIRAQVDCFGQFLSDFAVEVELSEVVIFNRAELYAGTCDGFVTLLNPNTGRRERAIIDYKTSKGVYPETCLQLAAYRYGDFYMAEDGDRVGLPGVESAYVIWLPASGGYQVVPMQADRGIYRVFLHAKALAHFSEHGRKGVGKALVLPVPQEQTSSDTIQDAAEPVDQSPSPDEDSGGQEDVVTE